MCEIPDLIPMRPAVVSTPTKVRNGTMIIIMECPEYDITVSLLSETNTVYTQIWTCPDLPGWYNNWEEMRTQMALAYKEALTT